MMIVDRATRLRTLLWSGKSPHNFRVETLLDWKPASEGRSARPDLDFPLRLHTKPRPESSVET